MRLQKSGTCLPLLCLPAHHTSPAKSPNGNWCKIFQHTNPMNFCCVAGARTTSVSCSKFQSWSFPPPRRPQIHLDSGSPQATPKEFGCSITRKECVFQVSSRFAGDGSLEHIDVQDLSNLQWADLPSEVITLDDLGDQDVSSCRCLDVGHQRENKKFRRIPYLNLVELYSYTSHKSLSSKILPAKYDVVSLSETD